MNRKLFHSQSLINARVVILSEAKDLRRNSCLTPVRLIHHTTLSFRAKRGICFLTPYQKPVILSEAKDLRHNPCLTPVRLIHHTTLSFRAKRGICFLTPYQKPVILSEAKDLRRERRPDASIHGAATPISIFQFPFSTLPGGTAKP
jgi:hypothetical protein